MRIDFGDHAIRDLRADDASALAKYANNRKIWQNLRDGFPHPYTLADAEDFLAKMMQMDPRTVFAIATADEVIGCIGQMPGEDVHRFSAEMGYWLAEPFWGRGIMSEAVERFTEYAFAEFGLNRIFAEPYVGNEASARVLEKAGYVCEGVMRANVLKDGKVLDQYLYAKVRARDQ